MTFSCCSCFLLTCNNSFSLSTINHLILSYIQLQTRSLSSEIIHLETNKLRFFPIDIPLCLSIQQFSFYSVAQQHKMCLNRSQLIYLTGDQHHLTGLNSFQVLLWWHCTDTGNSFHCESWFSLLFIFDLSDLVFIHRITLMTQQLFFFRTLFERVMLWAFWKARLF